MRLTPLLSPASDAPAHILRTAVVGINTDESLDLITGGAIFSPCEVYRYVLWRLWGAGPIWLYGMLNPSRADEKDGDNTVDRQMERARRNGAGGGIVVNSGALRETDRLKAIRHQDPIGPDNEYWIEVAIACADRLILAYGPDAAKFGGDKIMQRLFGGLRCFTLTTTKNGTPGHPLYVGYDAPLVPYEWSRAA